MQMIRWRCGVSMKDRRTSIELRRLVGVEHIHDVRLYSVLDTVVISGEDVCCSVVFGTLVGVFVLCGLRC